MWTNDKYDLIEQHKAKVRALAEMIARSDFHAIAVGYIPFIDETTTARAEAFDKMEFLEAVDYLVDKGYEFTNDAIAELVMDAAKHIAQMQK